MEDISGYCGAVVDDIDTGRIPEIVAKAAWERLLDDDLPGAMATLDGVPRDEVHTGGPLSWARKKVQALKERRHDKKEKKEANRLLEDQIDEAKGAHPTIKALIDPDLQRRIQAAIG